MTEVRTFTIWFNIHFDESPAEMQKEIIRLEAARRVAEALGHEFEESESEIRTARDFGYTAPVAAAEEVLDALQAAGALHGNAVYADEDLPTADPAAYAVLAAAESRHDISLTEY